MNDFKESNKQSLVLILVESKSTVVGIYSTSNFYREANYKKSIFKLRQGSDK